MNPLAVGLIVLSLGTFFALAQFKVVPNMGEIVGFLGIRPGQIPFMMSLFTVFGIFLSIPTGGLIQRFGPKMIVMTASAVLIIGSVIGGFAQNSAVMLASRAVEGVGNAFMAVAGTAMVATYTRPEKIGRAMGIWVCWVALGQIIGFNLTPVLFGVMDWHNIWFIYASVTLLAALLVLITMKLPVSVTAAQPSKVSAEKLSLSSVFKNRNLMLAGIGFSGFNALILGLLTWIVSYQEGLLGLTQASFMASIPMIGCLVAGPFYGNLSIKIGCKKLFMLGITGASVGFILAFTTAIPVIYIGVIIFGLIGLSTPAMAFSSVPGLVGDPRYIGMGSGIMNTFQGLGMFLGSQFFPNFVALGGNQFVGALIFAVLVGLIALICLGLAKFR